MMDKKVKTIIVILVVILVLLLLFVLIQQGPVKDNLITDENQEAKAPFVVYEAEESMMTVAGGGYTHTVLLSNGDGNYSNAVSVGCNITPFSLSLEQVNSIQKIITENKIYDEKCLVTGGTDYYVKYIFGDGDKQWFINDGAQGNWISEECKPYFYQIGEIILTEVANQQSNQYYSEECA